MSFRDDLAGVIARDSRYSIHAYIFIFDAIDFTKKIHRRPRTKPTRRRPSASHHVTGQQLCQGACALALAHYGLLARAVLGRWGIRSTSDLGEIVYNLIASGDLEKTSADSRSDFDDVFDLQEALVSDFTLMLDDVA